MCDVIKKNRTEKEKEMRNNGLKKNRHAHDDDNSMENDLYNSHNIYKY